MNGALVEVALLRLVMVHLLKLQWRSVNGALVEVAVKISEWCTYKSPTGD